MGRTCKGPEGFQIRNGRVTERIEILCLAHIQNFIRCIEEILAMLLRYAAFHVLDIFSGGFGFIMDDLAENKIGGLNAVRPFIDRQDARIAVELSDACFLYKAHAAENLERRGRDLAGHVGAPGLDDRGQKLNFFLGVFRAFGRMIERERRFKRQRPARNDFCFHGFEHPADIGMFCDDNALPGCGGFSLYALVGVGERFLIGAFGNRHALKPNGEACVIHHGEHIFQAHILLPDQGADGSIEFHSAGRGSVNAQLMLQPDTGDGVTRSVIEKFGHNEERDSLHVFGSVRRAGENEMDDVLRHVVLAVGDENLLAADLISAVRLLFRFRANEAEVRAGLRLGEVHGAGPLSCNESGQVFLFLSVRTVQRNRLNRPLIEQRAQAERHIGPLPHFLDAESQRPWQALSAIFRIEGHGVPAALAILPVGFLKAGGRGDRAVFKFCAGLVAGMVQGGEDFRGQLCRLLQH